MASRQRQTAQKTSLGNSVISTSSASHFGIHLSAPPRQGFGAAAWPHFGRILFPTSGFRTSFDVATTPTIRVVTRNLSLYTGMRIARFAFESLQGHHLHILPTRIGLWTGSWETLLSVAYAAETILTERADTPGRGRLGHGLSVTAQRARELLVEHAGVMSRMSGGRRLRVPYAAAARGGKCGIWIGRRERLLEWKRFTSSRTSAASV